MPAPGVSIHTVSVTGHRRLDLTPGPAGRLADAIDVVLVTIAGMGEGRVEPGYRPRVVSGLAEGADRLVARRALALGIPLKALLPFPRVQYLDDFEDERSRAEFAELIARASEVVELPGDADDRDSAYATLGRRLVEVGDILLAIWDGLPGRGQGGTERVIARAIEQGLPVLWIHAAHPHDLAIHGGGAFTPLPRGSRALAAGLARVIA